MSRTAYGGPKLPKALLDQVQGGRASKHSREPSRKERRKAERSAAHAKPQPRKRQHVLREEPVRQAAPQRKLPSADAPPPKSILKQKRPVPPPASESHPESEDSGEESAAPVLSRTVKARLEEDDDEISRLEKKLGIKKSETAKAAGEEDDLDWLLGQESDTSEDRPAVKRKRPDDERWLKDKRRKAQGSVREDDDEDDEDLGNAEVDDDGMEGLENPFSADELSDDDELNEGVSEDSDDPEDFHGNHQTEPPQKRTRENPYVAPVTATSSAKYVPPSLRKAPESDDEALQLVKRQLQGLLNRLSEANLISILHGIEDLYTRNARQYVTSALVQLLGDVVSDAAVLNDSFLILHAGFATAVYRVVGVDFGAQMLEHLVNAFDRYHGSSDGKQAINLLAFLSNLYTLQAISCEILFDYIRILLEDFSEANTELLLRIIRISGSQLRQDDPLALKDIVLLLQRAVAKLGEDNLSVRTKFMIETIQNLKNNRMKTGKGVSALLAEHTTSMKKTLGSLSQGARSVKATEPLRITLADIRDTEKKGKWWLVGASWRNSARTTSQNAPEASNPADNVDPEDSDSDPDLPALARAQGMNTPARAAIFTALTGAADARHARMRLLKLNLKAKQQLEIPRVVLHCTAAEPVYNHFYTLVAMGFCGDHRLRKAWEFGLLEMRCFRDGEGSDDEDEEEDEADGKEVPKTFNQAKLYAHLVAAELLRIDVLKRVNLLVTLRPLTTVFLEVFATTLFLALRKKAGKTGFPEAVGEVFGHARRDMVVGWRVWMEEVLPRTEVVKSGKDRGIVRRGIEAGIEGLENAGAGGAREEETASEDESG